MNNDRRPYRVNGKEIVVDAENVNYGNTNVASVLDDIDTRVDALENSDGSETLSVLTYTEDDCTVENTAIYINGTVGTNNNYNSTDYIPIPADKKWKMYVKFNYMLDTYGIYFYTKRSGSYDNGFISAIGGVTVYTDWTEVTLPDLADAIRFSYKKTSGNHISVKFVEQAVADTPAVKLKVAAWNIGGFSNGGSVSTITDANAEEKRIAYRTKIDDVNADIICISEYYRTFNMTTSSQAKDEVFCNYPYYKLGKVETLNNNCVFSKFPIVSTREIDYTVKDMNRYIKEVTLKLNGKIVKVVATHCSSENDPYHTINYGPDQFEQLVELYENDPYVIIGADFNVHTTDQIGDYVSGDGTDGYLNYKYFTEAGYTLMNFDYLNIKNPNDSAVAAAIGPHTADNIAVKGFAIGKREYVDTGNLSDHLMVACELVML